RRPDPAGRIPGPCPGTARRRHESRRRRAIGDTAPGCAAGTARGLWDGRARPPGAARSPLGPPRLLRTAGPGAAAGLWPYASGRLEGDRDRVDLGRQDEIVLGEPSDGMGPDLDRHVPVAD